MYLLVHFWASHLYPKHFCCVTRGRWLHTHTRSGPTPPPPTLHHHPALHHKWPEKCFLSHNLFFPLSPPPPPRLWPPVNLRSRSNTRKCHSLSPCFFFCILDGVHRGGEITLPPCGGGLIPCQSVVDSPFLFQVPSLSHVWWCGRGEWQLNLFQLRVYGRMPTAMPRRCVVWGVSGSRGTVHKMGRSRWTISVQKRVKDRAALQGPPTTCRPSIVPPQLRGFIVCRNFSRGVAGERVPSGLDPLPSPNSPNPLSLPFTLTDPEGLQQPELLRNLRSRGSRMMLCGGTRGGSPWRV